MRGSAHARRRRQSLALHQGLSSKFAVRFALQTRRRPDAARCRTGNSRQCSYQRSQTNETKPIDGGYHRSGTQSYWRGPNGVGHMCAHHRRPRQVCRFHSPVVGTLVTNCHASPTGSAAARITASGVAASKTVLLRIFCHIPSTVLDTTKTWPSP